MATKNEGQTVPDKAQQAVDFLYQEHERIHGPVEVQKPHEANTTTLTIGVRDVKKPTDAIQQEGTTDHLQENGEGISWDDGNCGVYPMKLPEAAKQAMERKDSAML